MGEGRAASSGGRALSEGVLFDAEAERTVIGSLLANLDPAHFEQVAATMQPRHLADQRNRAIYAAMLDLALREATIDLVTVREELQSRGELEAAGGVAYLAGLLDGLPRVSALEAWTRSVYEKARRRALRDLAARCAQATEDGAHETDTLIDSLRVDLERLVDSGARGVRSIAEVLPEAVRELEAFAMSERECSGVPTGLSDLDRLTMGLRPGALWIIAARPARGKSALCTQIATHAASEGRRVLLFSMEMPPPDVVQRMILAEARLDRWELRAQERGWSRVAAAVGQVSRLPIWFDPRESPTVAEIRATARRHRTVAGVDLIVVDYLQRLTVDNRQDRWLSMGDAVKNLKSLARQLNVPVLASCQLNAEAEEKRPTMGNLAQSAGIISAEADVIAFLHPADLRDWRDPAIDRPAVNLHIDKHRGGPVAELPLVFDRHITRFRQATPEEAAHA